MKTLTLGIISLAFSASVATASDYFDVFNYDPDLDPDLQEDVRSPLAIQQGVGDTYGHSEVDHTESDGGIKNTDASTDIDS